MKKNKQLFSFLLHIIISGVAVLNFSSCSKDDPDNIFAFAASLNGVQATPPNVEIGTGLCNATYDSITNKLIYTITWKELTGTPTAINFEKPVAGIPDFTNIPVTGFPAENTGSVGGNIIIAQEDEANLLHNSFYLNINTAAYNDGEIRGQLMQTH
jgi:hypothetical protein